MQRAPVLTGPVHPEERTQPSTADAWNMLVFAVIVVCHPYLFPQ